MTRRSNRNTVPPTGSPYHLAVKKAIERHREGHGGPVMARSPNLCGDYIAGGGR